ncbi:hypothetical protein BDZ91DRAFT_323269 [Kalaharituber pfeilii]|nr:hypothetical protein BDZ91DRAFT_323269 [Kalaharituber pfeilii]
MESKLETKPHVLISATHFTCWPIIPHTHIIPQKSYCGQGLNPFVQFLFRFLTPPETPKAHRSVSSKAESSLLPLFAANFCFIEDFPTSATGGNFSGSTLANRLLRRKPAGCPLPSLLLRLETLFVILGLRPKLRIFEDATEETDGATEGARGCLSGCSSTSSSLSSSLAPLTPSSSNSFSCSTSVSTFSISSSGSLGVEGLASAGVALGEGVVAG